MNYIFARTGTTGTYGETQAGYKYAMNALREYCPTYYTDDVIEILKNIVSVYQNISCIQEYPSVSNPLSIHQLIIWNMFQIPGFTLDPKYDNK